MLNPLTTDEKGCNRCGHQICICGLNEKEILEMENELLRNKITLMMEELDNMKRMIFNHKYDWYGLCCRNTLRDLKQKFEEIIKGVM